MRHVFQCAEALEMDTMHGSDFTSTAYVSISNVTYLGTLSTLHRVVTLLASTCAGHSTFPTVEKFRDALSSLD